MKYLSLTVAATALLLAPTTAHAQLFGGFDNSTVLGGLAGAGIGGAIGSNLAGSGNRDEGTAIGAALGGLAGAAYGNRQSNFYGNPYAGSFNPGFSGNSLLGTAVGAGIGGAIGSNLAGSGVRQEGTAIGAVLGGLAGNALTSRSRYNTQGFGGNYGPVGFNGGFGGNSRYGSNAPVMGGGFAPINYGPAFGAPNFAPQPFVPAPQFGATLPSFPASLPMGGTSFVPGGFVDAGTFANTTVINPPAPTFIPAPTPVYQPLSNAFTGVTVAAPQVTLAGPRLRSVSSRYADNPVSISTGSTVTQDYVGSTGVYSPKPLVLRSAPKSQLVVIERDHYTSSPAPISTHSYSSAHSHGAAVSYPAPAPSGPSIHADTVNINYGNNSQVGTTSSNNGSHVGNHHGQMPQYSAPSTPIDFGDGIGDGTWGQHSGAHSESLGSAQTGSYTVGTTSVLGGYEGTAGSYYVGSGQTFQVPSAPAIAANCENSTFGCAGGYSDTSAYGQSPHHVTTGGYKAKGYSFCDSDKVYNDDGALLLGASPVCR